MDRFAHPRFKFESCNRTNRPVPPTSVILGGRLLFKKTAKTRIFQGDTIGLTPSRRLGFGDGPLEVGRWSDTDGVEGQCADCPGPAGDRKSREDFPRVARRGKFFTFN